MSTVTYSLTAADYVEYLAHIRSRLTSAASVKRTVNRRGWIFNGVLVLGLGVIVAAQAEGSISWKAAMFVMTVGIVVLILLVFIPLLLLFIRQSQATDAAIRAGAEQGDFGPLGIPCTLTIDERGLHTRTPRDEATTYWHTVQRVERTENLVLILTWKTTGFIVPIRAFESPAAMEQFLAEIQKRRVAIAPPMLPGPLAPPRL